MFTVLLVIRILLEHLGYSYYFKINKAAMNHCKSFAKQNTDQNSVIKSTEQCSK